MIPQPFIEDLLNRLDIVEVIGRHVTLKRAGANFVACCPFHNEKTPSFTVSPSKQFYHCFGCSAHGTAIGFLIEHQGLSFVDAIEDLARGIGLSVPRDSHQPESGSAQHVDSTLPEVMSRAANYYRKALRASPRAIDYLKRRGLSGEIAKQYGLGYAPDDWQNLAAAFDDYASETLVTAGLVIAKEGKRFDRFRDRIMFPIADTRGRLIGFGGRVIDQGEPKYLNSPETPVFQKGHELYGLFQARKAIQQAGRALVVEGYMDVIALAQHEVFYAVATLGTATTPFHVARLFRHTDHIVFCFDGDDAGRRAAWRALENSLPLVTDAKSIAFLFLEQGEDPDSYIRKVGREAFEKTIANAMPLSEFLLLGLTRKIDLNSDEGRARLTQLAKPLLQKITAPALRYLLQQRLSELTHIAPADLARLTGTSRERARRRPSPPARRAPPSLQRRVLQLLLSAPELGCALPPSQQDKSSEEGAALVALLEFLRNSANVTNVALVLEHFRPTPHLTLLSEIAAETMTFDAAFDIAGELNDAFVQLERQAILARSARLLAQAQPSMDDIREAQDLKRRAQELGSK